jgi:hypothetical protein
MFSLWLGLPLLVQASPFFSLTSSVDSKLAFGAQSQSKSLKLSLVYGTSYPKILHGSVLLLESSSLVGGCGMKLAPRYVLQPSWAMGSLCLLLRTPCLESLSPAHFPAA